MIKVKSLEIREIEYSYDKRPKISGMDDVIKAVKPMIADQNKEFFITLYLNTKNGIIKQEVISVGSLSANVRLCKNYFFIMSRLPNKTRFLI
jgi:DNA repair protein RadC